MKNKSKYKKPTREDYISFFDNLISENTDYVHFSITGIFDREGLEHNKNMYQSSWWTYQKNIITFFRKTARVITRNRDWGKGNKDKEMKVILVPEVQSVLHFHGIISIHADFLKEVNLITFRELLIQFWDQLFRRGKFEIQQFENDGWLHYITKKLVLGDDIIEEFVILPPIAHQ